MDAVLVNKKNFKWSYFIILKLKTKIIEKGDKSINFLQLIEINFLFLQLIIKKKFLPSLVTTGTTIELNNPWDSCLRAERKVTEKLEEALKYDIIESVIGSSAWISPVVIAFKHDGDIRVW